MNLKLFNMSKVLSCAHYRHKLNIVKALLQLIIVSVVKSPPFNETGSNTCHHVI